MCWTTTLYHVLVHTHALSLVYFRKNVHFSKCIFRELSKVRKIKLSAKYVTHALKRMKKERERHATVAHHKPRSDLRIRATKAMCRYLTFTHTHSIWTRPAHDTHTQNRNNFPNNCTDSKTTTVMLDLWFWFSRNWRIRKTWSQVVELLKGDVPF